jgi:methyl-accepting chemotaxis protein
MIFRKNRQVSRLRRKLLLYFLLVSIVSVSVSAEIILEMSSDGFRNLIMGNFFTQAEQILPPAQLLALKENISRETLFSPVFDLRNRMILLLCVVTASIFGALYLFTKDIVHPMDKMVDATKKLAGGDLTVKVPVMTGDEIGQIASLINEMNGKLLDMIVQVKQDINRHKDKISAASHIITEMLDEENPKAVIASKKMKVSDYKNIMKVSADVVKLLEIMTGDLDSLKTFVNMYKTFSINSEISQDEIESAIKNFITRDNNLESA